MDTFEASGLRGELSLRSGDGNVDMDDVKGKLRLESGDGHVRLTNAEGALEARMSDGGLTVDGTFHAIALHTSDGNLDLTLRDGSKLTEASRIGVFRWQGSHFACRMTSQPTLMFTPAMAMWNARCRLRWITLAAMATPQPWAARQAEWRRHTTFDTHQRWKCNNPNTVGSCAIPIASLHGSIDAARRAGINTATHTIINNRHGTPIKVSGSKRLT